MEICRSKKNELGEIDKDLYILGIVGIVTVLVFWVVYKITGFSVFSIKYPCFFKSVTGLWCPGCGGTRSVRALLHGNIWQSFIDYPPVIYGVIVYSEFMVRCFLRRHFNGNFGPKKDGAIIPFIYVGLVLMLLQWIVKLVALIGFGISWIR